MGVVLKGTLVFRFWPRLGLKTGVSAQAEQYHKQVKAQCEGSMCRFNDKVYVQVKCSKFNVQEKLLCLVQSQSSVFMFNVHDLPDIL